MKEETANLFFKENGSDKVYHTYLQKGDHGKWQVAFAYGRRGSSLVTGDKGSDLSYDEGKKIFDKLVKSKTAKGYKVENSNTASFSTVVGVAKDTSFRPQLLNEISEEEVEKYINDDGWCAQEKYDGRNRLIIKLDDSTAIGANRKGLEVAIPDGVRDEMEDMPGYFVIAGEAIDDYVMCFDIISMKKSFIDRDKALKDVLVDCKHLRSVYTAWERKDKINLLRKLKKSNAEGIVFKQKDAYYTPGRPASGGSQLKFKFTQSASVICGGANKGTRSVSMLVYEGTKLINIGNVTVYPNQEIPERGKILEVKYLYYFKGGSLFQPVLLNTDREDIDQEDCTIDQLKYKKED